MRSISLILLLLCLQCAVNAQALRDINYRYRYNPEEAFVFQMHPVHTATGWVTHYKLLLRDSLSDPKEYSIRWELREELGDKDGKSLAADSSQLKIGKHAITGQIALSQQGKIFLTAKIQHPAQKKAWYFYQPLNEATPVNCFLKNNGKAIVDSYVKKGVPLQVADATTTSIVTYYRNAFPAGAPPFSESQGRVSKGIKADSVFQWPAGTEISLQNKGLYLVQQDTATQQGIAFRVEEDYPRLAKVESLADPLVYICTKEEFQRVKVAKGDKKAFDKVILGITGDAERASTLFRSYFRRVELANEYFTSYKEGWKTDRGMIFIIFGLPEEIFRFEDREVWSYKQDNLKLSLTFIRSSTLFDPDNFVLIRAKRYQETWYATIDLWRNARF
jgi:GWxTD domain-containing protein